LKQKLYGLFENRGVIQTHFNYNRILAIYIYIYIKKTPEDGP